MPMVSPWLTGVPLCLLLLLSSALAGQEVEVRIEGYHYVPASVSISVGDRVRWVNHEKRTSHSVVFPGEAGLESERMFPDESWVRDFNTPGRYNYHCGPHPEMEGVVVVGE